MIAENNKGTKVKVFIPPVAANIMSFLMERIADAKGEKPVLTSFNVYNLTRNNQFDSTKAKEELGYSTRSYEETLHDMLEWLFEQGIIKKEE